mmetsp:Transcript_2670/g.6147  ORF Transcript_2670/g.6147 Transcript_2670/m.6147 type:complete len:86 (-) Transcript_2670:26-283(-)
MIKSAKPSTPAVAMPASMPTLNSEDAEQSLIKIIARSRQVILLRVRQKNGRGARDDFDKRTRKRRDTKRSANFASNGVGPIVRPV